MSISTAIGSERRSRVSGYKIKRGFFDNETSNLPQVVVILAEANTANQAGITTAKKEITSADEAGQVYGFGSPIHQIMRILRPISSDGIGGIPTIVMPQLAAVGAAPTTIVWTVNGAATKNATHAIVVGGRETLDFKPYSFSVVSGDTPTIIAAKIVDAINNVPGSPFTAAAVAGVVTLTTKWKGASSANANAVISNNSNAAGVVYALTSTTPGSGLADISAALLQFEDNWYTTVINSYGVDALALLEAFNGVPDDEAPTGRYEGRIFKPFMAFFGSTLPSKDALIAITNAAARVDQVTNVLCPAPGSAGMPWEAAANMVALFARVMQDTPELDVNGKSYPDMPVPSTNVIGDMSVYDNRDLLVKNGCSTVLLDKGSYKVQDLVTTYHPSDETPLQFAYARNLNLDWNVKDAYSILENVRVKDHVLIKDAQVTDVSKAIKPKEWKAVLFDLFDDLGRRALFSDPDFSKKSLRVEISSTNPNRFETFFRYKRTGVARIESTDVEAGY